MRQFSEQEIVRREKLNEIAKVCNPYPERYEITHSLKEASTLPDETKGVRVAGRIVFMRKMGKLSFVRLRDIEGDLQISIKIDLVGEEKYQFFKTLWFLPILFIVQFAYWGIQKISGKGIHFVCALMLCASLFLYYKNINLPYFVDTVLLTLPYYHCGSVFYQNKCRIEKMGVHVAFSLILIPLLIAALAMYNVDYKYNIVPWYNHILSLMTIVGGYVILNKAQLKASFIEKIGKNSIFYLGLHRSFFLLFLPVLSRLSIGAYLQSFILCILTTLSIYFLINCMGEKKKMLLGNIK